MIGLFGASGEDWGEWVAYVRFSGMKKICGVWGLIEVLFAFFGVQPNGRLGSPSSLLIKHPRPERNLVVFSVGPTNLGGLGQIFFQPRPSIGNT